MPELPEVEVVRAGLAPAVRDARIAGVEVRDTRALKRHKPVGVGAGAGAGDSAAVAADFERRLVGARLLEPVRRGKFLWMPLAGAGVAGASVAGVSGAGGAADASAVPEQALLAHLGMSGQMLLRAHEAADDRHVRVRLWIEHPEHGEMRVDFSDQRLFGSLAIDALVPTDDGFAAGRGTSIAAIPSQAAHIARDPLDPAFDDLRFITSLRTRNTAVKRALLDQGLISGVGNIYADESLWWARVHPETPGARLSARKAAELLTQVREVFAQALIEGGTSFDEQYVNVNGEAGYFAHSLNAYGRGGEACKRCEGEIKRVAFMNRSSHFCPRCQRRR